MSDLQDGKGPAGRPTTDEERVFLVVVDDSEEMRVALRYACVRARRTGGRVALLYVIEPADFQHWMAVEEIFRQERRDEAEALLQTLATEVQALTGKVPILYLREGARWEELLKLIADDGANISILVLAASAHGEGPGPLVSHLAGRMAGRLRIPFTVVPGGLSDEAIAQIS